MVRPWPDQPDRRRRLCYCKIFFCLQPLLMAVVSEKRPLVAYEEEEEEEEEEEGGTTSDEEYIVPQK